jgi:hypothetical protein
VSVGFPIINDLNGIQSEPDIRVMIGLSVTFTPQMQRST